MREQTKPIIESNSFIVLDKYTRQWETPKTYQSESDLERELVSDLVNQGYEFLPNLNPNPSLEKNPHKKSFNFSLFLRPISFFTKVQKLS